MSEFNLQVVPDPGFIHLKFEGVWNSQNSHQIIDAIFEHFSTSPHFRMLIDLRNEKYEPVCLSKNFEDAKYAASKIAGIQHRIATLEPGTGPEFSEDSEMFKLFAENRGVTLRYFFDIDDAMAWLTSE